MTDIETASIASVDSLSIGSDTTASSVTDTTTSYVGFPPNAGPKERYIDQQKKEAEELKAKANEALKQREFDRAIALYTDAIAVYPYNAVYWANRAQAYSKVESYGFSIEDASKAIELDPSYVKGYYRRAISHMAIAKHKLALRDFKLVVQRAPGDKDALAKFKECEKFVRRLDFEKAIQTDDPKGVAERIDPTSMTVEDSYDGPRIEGDNITEEFVEAMLERFRNCKTIHKKYMFQITLAVKKILESEPTMNEVQVGEGEIMTVCGDTHGQYFDLLNIFKLNGKPSLTHKYLFNGDFVDRGSWSTEVLLTLFAYKWLYPKSLYLNRGNHETDDMNKMYGFEGEAKHKYSELAFKLFSETFSVLPLATLIGDKFFVLHGGLFSNDDVTLDTIRKIDRFKYRQPGSEGTVCEMLWTDPSPTPGRTPSKRGVGLQFGPDVSKKFCQANGLQCVIRSHETKDEGYVNEKGGDNR